jgi:predicted small lipoprotein YifL
MTHRARAMVLAVLLTGAASSCGQQGPLILRDDARPIEPVQPPANEPEQSNDEEQDER